MMTRRAGRLSPAARVGVEAMHLISPALNPPSTIFRCSRRSPAWWKAAPRSTHAARDRSISVSASSVSSRAAAARAGETRFNAPAARFAKASALRREETKTRHCPPSATVSRQRFKSSNLEIPSTFRSPSANRIAPR